ncbi:DivIVA domain-containing protein [Saccharopolyspora spinosa]|nr:hypothetical protein [Saccharopolyspora spinosa]
MDDVVPARPAFAERWRGFDRAQVAEHLDLLESELRQLRQLREELRSTDEEEQHDSEVVEFAEKRAAAIIGQAREEAARLLAEAERTAEQIRAQACDFARLLAERRADLDRETACWKREEREREHRLRRNVQKEYKRITALAQEDAERLLDRTRRRCEQQDAASDVRYRRICAEAEERRQETGAAINALLQEVVKHSTALRELSLPNDGIVDGHTAHQPVANSQNIQR